jgi:hypothetical protein
LQTVVYRGGVNLWVAGRGGAILKRSESLSPIRTTSAPKIPPILRLGGSKTKSRTPLLTITDDGDIPRAAPPRKNN